MRATFVCESCEMRVDDPWQRVVVRTEYRLAHNQSRLRTTTDAYLCKGCALLAADGPGAVEEAPTLFLVEPEADRG